MRTRGRMLRRRCVDDPSSRGRAGAARPSSLCERTAPPAAPIGPRALARAPLPAGALAQGFVLRRPARTRWPSRWAAPVLRSSAPLPHGPAAAVRAPSTPSRTGARGRRTRSPPGHSRMRSDDPRTRRSAAPATHRGSHSGRRAAARAGSARRDSHHRAQDQEAGSLRTAAGGRVGARPHARADRATKLKRLRVRSVKTSSRRPAASQRSRCRTTRRGRSR